MARQGLPYYGLDLPVVIREISDKITELLPPEQREIVHYREVDATNYDSLEDALEDIDGPVCITTEGSHGYCAMKNKPVQLPNQEIAPVL